MKIPLEISKLFPKKNRVIALDIGSSSIKLAEFVYRQGRFVLSALKLKEIDLKQEPEKAQLTALKELLEGVDTKEANVHAVINCPRSTTRIFTIPHMPKQEIPQTLKWEIKDFTSLLPEEAVLDYKILQDVVEKGVKKLKACVACSSKATVDKYLALFHEVGIQPSLFTQPGFALENVLPNLVCEEGEAVAVLDMGYNISELFIFQEKAVSFSRKLPVAGRNFTQDMSQVLLSDLGKTELSPEEAERIKRDYGIPENPSSDVIEGKLTYSQLLSFLRPNVEKLASEIERSFNFYRQSHPDAKIERLILLGGAGSLKGLAKALSNSLEIPVELGNPLKGLLSEESNLFKEHLRSAHRFGQAIGAALSPEDTINLLPVEIKQKRRLLVRDTLEKSAIAAVAILLILTYIGMKIRLNVYNKHLDTAQLELTALAPRAEEVQRQAYKAATLQGRIYSSDILKEIGNRIPEEVRLTEMDVSNKSLNLKGEIRPSALAEEKILTEFMDNLSKGIFKQVSLVTTKKGTSALKPFTFELKLGLE